MRRGGRRPARASAERGSLAQKPVVVLVEDEPEIRRFLRVSLTGHGYRLFEALTGAEGLREAAARQPDVVVLDLGLPDMDGLEVIRQLRAWSGVPIIVLSARGQEQDKIAALDAGADDYVGKPFGVGELLARLRVSLRHAERTVREAGEPVFASGDLEVNQAERRVRVGGKEVHLTPIEYRLLATMVRHAGQGGDAAPAPARGVGPDPRGPGALSPRLHGAAPAEDRAGSGPATPSADGVGHRLSPRRGLTATRPRQAVCVGADATCRFRSRGGRPGRDRNASSGGIGDSANGNNGARTGSGGRQQRTCTGSPSSCVTMGSTGSIACAQR